MLPKKNRLTTKQFDAVWNRGTSRCGAFVCVRILPQQDDVRCACIAPKKHAKTAPARNRLRRQLYGAAKEGLAHVNKAHLIISPKATLSDISFVALSRDIAQTVLKASAGIKNTTKTSV